MQMLDRPMRSTLPGRLTASAVAGAALVLPFAALEWHLGGGFPDGVPLALFVALWLLAVAFLLVAWPLARALRTEAGGARRLARRWLAVAVALLLAWLWLSLVRDQMPCFLGVPNCD